MQARTVPTCILIRALAMDGEKEPEKSGWRELIVKEFILKGEYIWKFKVLQRH